MSSRLNQNKLFPEGVGEVGRLARKLSVCQKFISNNIFTVLPHIDAVKELQKIVPIQQKGF